MATSTPVAHVSAIQGQAFAKEKSGALRALQVGAPIFEADVVVTAEGGRIELTANDGRTLVVQAGETLTVDAEVMGLDLPDTSDSALLANGADISRVIKAINEGGSLDALLEETAAGEGGGGTDGGPSFVRLLRIAESVAPLNFEFDTTRVATVDEGGSNVGSPTDALAGGPEAETGTGGGAGGTPAANAPVAVDDLIHTPINTAVDIDVKINDTDSDSTSAQLTVSNLILSNPAQGTVTLNADGTVHFVPATNVSGPVTFTYTLTDQGGLSSAATVTVNVGVNAPPDSADVAVTTEENTPVALHLADFAFSDADAGQSLTNVRIDSLPVAGTLSLNGMPVAPGAIIALSEITAGHLIFSPAPGDNGRDYARFTFSVQDSAGAFDSSPNTVTLNVTPVNDAPVANPDSLNATEDTPVTYTAAQLLGNDTDADGDTLTIASVTSGTNGTAVLNADGTVTFTPTANYNGPADFTYTVSDGTAISPPATVTINVASANDMPVANPDSLNAVEDTPATYTAAQLLGNDTDADGDTLTIASVTSGANGTAVLNADGTVTFTPTANYNGPADFTYTVSDGTLTSAPATVIVNVAPFNDIPVAAPDSLNATEDTPATYTAAQLLSNDTDADGDTLTIVSVTSGSNGTAVLNADGTVTFTPTANYNGPADFTYTVSDGTLTSAPATVTINVGTGNDTPVANDDALNATEDTPATYTAAQLLGNDTDADGDTLTIASVTSGANGTAVLNADGTVTFTPAANYNGPADFIYTVSDGTATSAPATVTINVDPVNDAPVIDLDADDSHNIVSVQPITGLFNTGVDANGLRLAAGAVDLHYAVIAQPGGGSVTSTATSHSAWVANDADSSWIGSGTGNLPTGLYQYQTSFSLQAGADPTSVHIEMDVASDNFLRDVLVNGVSTGISSALSYRGLTHIALDGGSAAFQAGANTITFMVENRDPGYPATSGPTGLRVDNLTSSVAVIGSDVVGHQPDYAAIYVEGTPVAIADSDVRILDVDNTSLQGATITLTNAQPGDVLLASSIAGITATLNAARTEVVLSGNASLADYETAIRSIQFSNITESPSTAVDRTITVVVNDGSASSNVGTTTIRVVAVSDAPTLDLDANESAAPGTAYAASYIENAAGVAIADSDVVISDVDSANIRCATIHLIDGLSGDRLVAGGLPAGIVASSYDPVAGIITLSGDASLAVFQTALRAITFSSTSNDPGSATRHIEVTVNDGSNNSNTAVTTINVVPVNDAPVNTLPTAQSVNEDMTLVFSAGNLNPIRVSDTDSGTLTTTVSISNGTLTAVSGGASIAGNGTGVAVLSGTAAQINASLNGLSFTPAADYNGQATLTVSTSDGVAPVVVNTLDVNVVAVVDIVADSIRTNVGTAITFDPITGTHGASGDNFDNPSRVISAINGTAIAAGSSVVVTGGSVVLNADGTLTYTPSANYSGLPSFTYTVSAGGAIETAVVNVTVAGVPSVSITTDANNDAFISKTEQAAAGVDAVSIGLPGNARAGDTLTITDGSTPQTHVLTDADIATGHYDTAFAKPLEGGTLTVTATLTDASGIVSAPGSDSAVLDTVMPVAGITITSIAGDNVVNGAEASGAVSIVGTVGGDVRSGDTVSTTINGHLYTGVVAADNVSYSIANVLGSDLMASAGMPVVVSITVQDQAGNSVTASANHDFSTEASLSATTTVLDANASGLRAEYYGYNDTTQQTYLQHSDDTLYGNLNTIADMQSIINGRNGGDAVVGTILAAGASAPDAVFRATDINYGLITGDLGNNTGTTHRLDEFLQAVDAASVTGSVGRTTDVGIRFIGYLDSPAGSYDIRIRSDDGFRLMIDGSVIGQFDSIRSPGQDLVTNVNLDGGLTPIEILYWDQGGQAVLHIEFKPAGAPDSAYSDLGTGSLALLTPTGAPVLTPLQDIIADPAHAGQYLIQTGQEYTGTLGGDQITGSAGRDIIHGGAGNDTINGGANDDTIDGGSGHDILVGGLGSDVFAWHFGDQGTAGSPARDVITDFSSSVASGSKDVLNLHDLLQGENHATGIGNLDHYLHFETTTTNDTIVHISSTGAFASGDSASDIAGKEDQLITLLSVDLTAAGTDQQIIQDLLNKGKLITD